MKAQKGQVTILALIVLAVGSIVIAPNLSYIRTSLTSQSIYRRGIIENYSADAGVEHALWRLQNDAAFRTSAASSPQPLTLDINGNMVNITVGIPSTPSSLEPFPTQESGNNLFVTVNRNPGWITSDNPVDIQYSIIVYNYGTNQVYLRKIIDTLPPGFGYVPGSTSGITTDSPSVVGETLTWSFEHLGNPPDVGYPLTPLWQASLNFRASASQIDNGGIYYNQVELRATAMAKILTDKSAPVWVNIYEITVKTGNTTVLVSASRDELAGVKILTWKTK